MKPFLVFTVLAVACWLLFRSAPRWKQMVGPRIVRPVIAGRRGLLPDGAPEQTERGPATDSTPTRGGSWRRPRAGPADGTEMVRLVRELSALLAAGRSGSQLWADVMRARAGPAWTTGPASGETGRPLAGRDVVRAFLMAQLRAAHRAAQMGLSPSEALRGGCAVAPLPSYRDGELRVWRGLAACLDVAEISGAPLATVLQRFAVQLESDLDAAAIRETALAGPKATVRLLTWLPVLGLGLGMLMGVDPVSFLIGGPVGWAALLSGTGLMIAGRYWSRTLISAAAASEP